MGLPSFLIPLIKGSAETLIVTTPEEEDGEWRMQTVTGTEPRGGGGVS
jgi:hypothetical protein